MQKNSHSLTAFVFTLILLAVCLFRMLSFEKEPVAVFAGSGRQTPPQSLFAFLTGRT